MSTPQPTIPAPVAEVYHPLQQELLNIHVKWQLFRQLFGTDPDRIELLNCCAGVLFGTVQEVMYDDVVLSLFRLADEPGSGQRKNLTLDRLAAVVSSINPPLGNSLQSRSAIIGGLLAPYSDWRHKRIAQRFREGPGTLRRRGLRPPGAEPGGH
jgi:hypothetical protein